eukprot:g6816.t1
MVFETCACVERLKAKLDRTRNFTMTEKLVLGSAQFGLVYGRTNTTGLLPTSKVAEIVKFAADNGVKNLDTARAYGVAEERIGEIFNGDQKIKDSVAIITKLAPFDNIDLAGVNSINPAILSGMVDGSVFRSCRELKRHSLQTLCLHRCSHLGSPVWSRLLQLRDEGVIEKLGVSVQNVDECYLALKNKDVKHIQLPVNLIDWRWRTQEFLDLCSSRQDVTIHCRGSLLQGILVNDSHLWPKIDGVDAVNMVKILDDFVQKFELKNKLALCFGFVLSLPYVDGLVLGVDNLKQMEENVEMFKSASLTEDQRNEISQAFSIDNVPEQLLDPAQWPKK